MTDMHRTFYDAVEGAHRRVCLEAKVSRLRCNTVLRARTVSRRPRTKRRCEHGKLTQRPTRLFLSSRPAGSGRADSECREWLFVLRARRRSTGARVEARSRRVMTKCGGAHDLSNLVLAAGCQLDLAPSKLMDAGLQSLVSKMWASEAPDQKKRGRVDGLVVRESRQSRSNAAVSKGTRRMRIVARPNSAAMLDWESEQCWVSRVLDSRVAIDAVASHKRGGRLSQAANQRPHKECLKTKDLNWERCEPFECGFDYRLARRWSGGAEMGI